MTFLLQPGIKGLRPINQLNLTLSNIKLNGHLLILAKSVMYLGIEIDKALSGNNQIDALAKKLCRTNRIFSKLRYYIPTQTFTSILLHELFVKNFMSDFLFVLYV